MTNNTTAPIVPGKYQHYKGQYYQVFGVAQHSETQEPLVVYQTLYGEGSLWVRPLSMFVEEVQGQDGENMPRFRLITAEESPIPYPVQTTAPA